VTDSVKQLEILKHFCQTFGPSSMEEAVARLIPEYLGETFTCQTTPHRNMVAFQPHVSNHRQAIVIQAHMDELAFKPTRYLENGLIEVYPVSALPMDACNQRVIFQPGNIPGLLTVQQKDKQRFYYVDIGAASAQDARDQVPVYAVGAYQNDVVFRGTQAVGKSFDDRAAVAAMVCALASEQCREQAGKRVIALFTVREETFFWSHREVTRVVSDLDVKAGLFVNIESCPANKPPVSGGFNAELGKGVVIAHMDKSYVAFPHVSRQLMELAATHEIPIQNMVSNKGHGELGKLCYELETPGIGLAIPSLFMHSPNSVIDVRDFDALVRLVMAIITDYQP